MEEKCYYSKRFNAGGLLRAIVLQITQLILSAGLCVLTLGFAPLFFSILIAILALFAVLGLIRDLIEKSKPAVILSKDSIVLGLFSVFRRGEILAFLRDKFFRWSDFEIDLKSIISANIYEPIENLVPEKRMRIVYRDKNNEERPLDLLLQNIDGRDRLIALLKERIKFV